MLYALILVEVLALAGASNSATQLNYFDQEGWGDICTDQALSAQSPIDIKDCEGAEGGDMVSGEGFESMELKNLNNANSIKFKVDDKNLTVPWIENRKVHLQQLHMHWGKNSKEGSEHLVEGQQYAAEFHLVTSYTDVNGTTKDMVFARLFEASKKEGNEQVEQMISASEVRCKSKHGHEDVEDRKCNRDLSEFNLAALYLNGIGTWYSYHGSLTTPNCTEIVHWVVVQDPLKISLKQLKRLRKLKLGDGHTKSLKFNWRKTQKTNDRVCTIYT